MSAKQQTCATGPLELVAIRLSAGMPIRPALVDRPWMETPAGRFAKRCLPLMIANQAGWELLNPSGFTAAWQGGDELAAVTIWPDAGMPAFCVTSHFGSGILTWHVPYLFRTPRGYNLLVRGPANRPKDGISALEGIVETDWTAATFTMNWKFTRPGTRSVSRPASPSRCWYRCGVANWKTSGRSCGRPRPNLQPTLISSAFLPTARSSSNPLRFRGRPPTVPGGSGITCSAATWTGRSCLSTRRN